MEERLHKILARSGVCSRRRAEELIREGRVSIDGVIVRKMGVLIDPTCSAITVDGGKIAIPSRRIYLLLNKPKGYVTTLHDPQGRPTVLSLLKDIKERVFPVGRLDQDTEGALILTNDGDFAHRILHPRFEIRRTYHATVRGIPAPVTIRRLARGVEIDGRKTWPADVRLLSSGRETAVLELTIHEGRKRQVRKMCDAVGHPVLFLRRVSYGGLGLNDLALGRYRFLGEKDIKLILSI